MSDQPSNEDSTKTTDNLLWEATRGHPFAAGLILVAVLWIGVLYVPSRVFELRTDVAGQYGDTFGMMNALIGGFTLVGVAYAAWLQHEALKDARQALRDGEGERERTDA